VTSSPEPDSYYIILYYIILYCPAPAEPPAAPRARRAGRASYEMPASESIQKSRCPHPVRRRAVQEFGDVVFEDVVFHNNSFAIFKIEGTSPQLLHLQGFVPHSLASCRPAISQLSFELGGKCAHMGR